MHAARTLASTEPDRLHVRVVARGELAHSEDGLTRGWAHLDLAEVPPGAPGWLDFPPLVLAAVGTNFPGEAFPMHRHENIENVLVIERGRVEHRDTLGNACELGEGDACVLSAGSGVEHAERVLGDATVRAIVLWIRPAQLDEAPSFHRGSFPRRDGWTVVASGRPGEHAALPLGRDVELRRGVLARGACLEHPLVAGRRIYAIVRDGALEVAGASASDGDRVLVEGAGLVRFVAREPGEVVLVDMV
jgi:redox-sensitive bicupin YhaK (pirin superfamily)